MALGEMGGKGRTGRRGVGGGRVQNVKERIKKKDKSLIATEN